MYRGETVSVVIPCLNEAAGLRYLLARTPPFVDEVIVVDNRSTDDTAAVAAQCGAIVVTESRRGYGHACRTGFARAAGEIIATLDGDGSYPMEAIAPMIDVLDREGADFVSASRFPLDDPRAMSRASRVGNRLLTGAVRLLYPIRMVDSQSGMWAFRRHCLPALRLGEGGMAFSQEIKLDVVIAPRLRFAEYHIAYAPRIGETKLSILRDGAGNIQSLIRHRLRSRVASSDTDVRG